MTVTKNLFFSDVQVSFVNVLCSLLMTYLAQTLFDQRPTTDPLDTCAPDNEWPLALPVPGKLPVSWN